MFADLVLTAQTVGTALASTDLSLILAAERGGSTGDPMDFFNTPLGKPILALLRTLGVIVVLFTLLKSAKEFISGKIGPGVKILASGLLFAAICIQPSLLVSLISVVSGLLQAVADTFKQVTA